MRIRVGAVNKVSRAALALAVAAYGWWLFAPGAAGLVPPLAWAIPAHIGVGYLLTTLSFAAFPSLRRADLTRGAIVAFALAAFARYLAGHDWAPLSLAAETVGATAVMVSSQLERFRSVARGRARAPFSMMYPHDRRRRRAMVRPASTTAPVEASLQAQ